MMRTSVLALAAVAAVTPFFAFCETGPTTLPSTAAVSQVSGLTLRSLPAVLDARERHRDWHTAADQAGNRIQNPGLKSQFNQRLAGIVPAVAKLLIGHPQDYALVTVGVYRTKNAPDKQALLAVTVDGLESQIGSDFFADVVAGLPQIPSGEGIPAGLQLDTEATSYLVFFLGQKQLEAGDIPHTVFGKSIMLATNRARSNAQDESAAGTSALARANAAPARDGAAESAQNTNLPNVVNNAAAANASDGGQPAGYAEPGSPYGYAYNYPLANDGYYYPGVGVPYVILPGEAETTPQIQQRQIQREHRLERAYQQRAGGTGNGNPAAGASPINSANQTSVAGNNTAQEQATRNGEDVSRAGPGSSATSVGGQGATTPRTFPRPGQPGGAPARSNAPATPAPSNNRSTGGNSGGVPHPAPGAPGGAPAGGGKK